MVGSYLLSPVTGGLSVPIGTVASTSIWVLSEIHLNKTVRSQRRLLSKELKKRLKKEIEQYGQAVDMRLRQLYSQLLEDTKNEQQQWLATKAQAIQISHQTQENIPDWQKLIDQAKAIQSEIKEASESVSSNTEKKQPVV